MQIGQSAQACLSLRCDSTIPQGNANPDVTLCSNPGIHRSGLRQLNPDFLALSYSKSRNDRIPRLSSKNDED
jgi:hypothetical protein